MFYISAADVNEAGLVFNVVGAALLAWCAPACLTWKRDGRVGVRREAPSRSGDTYESNEATLVAVRRNHKKAKYGMPIGWILFVIGCSLQLLALHMPF
jgi:hypothetical protein